MSTVRKLLNRSRVATGAFGVLLVIVLTLLTGCGGDAQSTPAKTSSGDKGSQPVVAPTTKVAGYGTDQGCASDVIVTNPPKANVIALLSGTNEPTVFARTGDIIEFRFPFGKKWGKSATTPEGLTMENPAGYAVKSDKVCVWRFTAQKAGTYELHFSDRPLCKAGAMCPMHIIDVPVTLAVK
ncbi:hypothetical protein KDA_14690 [Dictyobacter alpinus]|uniref:Uncharacterized protein n=1 Tax=Dictyobacter alpinus TaxID=2014873 RepID=A0A402B3Q8_9CHLR|nr:hypothetical protein [Dictyobacter alpinus]GCE25985.1 hypothetical protein KDA_14690 [Dictyobacter alpinus]